MPPTLKRFVGHIAFALAVFVHLSHFLARLYESTSRTIAVATALALLKMFLVKVFKSLYVLNLWMDLVDILPDVR